MERLEELASRLRRLQLVHETLSPRDSRREAVRRELVSLMREARRELRPQQP